MEFGGHDADAILSAQFLRALGLLCKPVEPPAASTPRPPPTPARRAGHDGLKPGEVTRVAEPGHPATFKYDSVSVLSSTSSGPAATVQEMVRGAQFYSHLSDPHAPDTHCGLSGTQEAYGTRVSRPGLVQPHGVCMLLKVLPDLASVKARARSGKQPPHPHSPHRRCAAVGPPTSRCAHPPRPPRHPCRCCPSAATASPFCACPPRRC